VPASHAFGLACLLAGVGAAGTAVLLDGGNAVASVVATLREGRAEVLHGTPTLFAALLRAGATVPARTGFTAGSSCPAHVLRDLEDRGLSLLNLYGMSEIGAATCCRDSDPAAVRHGTVGRPLPGYEIRIARGASASDEPEADAGTPLAARTGTSETGEIQVRSAVIATGYHRRPWGPEDVTEQGWFRTGDLGSLDPQGNLLITGRTGDVVHVGGFNVFPAEVEAFLTSHPSIEQAVVVGIEHAVHGEALRAYVVPAAGTSLRERDVIAYARAGIAGYKVPYSVLLLEEIPMLASGKPDRSALLRAESVAASPPPPRRTVQR
jgi:long-chain acyl-CoA synthetase